MFYFGEYSVAARIYFVGCLKKRTKGSNESHARKGYPLNPRLCKTNAKLIQKSVKQAYEKRYEDIHFDRSQLFELINKTYHPKNVLYAGCSIHLTPAFYFPRITFVDKSNETIQYFSDLQEILLYINKRKHYIQKSQLQFKCADYKKPGLQTSYDLLISLFSPRVIEYCSKYVRKDGMVLTHNYQEEARVLINNTSWKMIAYIDYHRGKYIIHEKARKEIMERKHGSRYLRTTNDGTEYIEKEKYYIFERVK